MLKLKIPKILISPNKFDIYRRTDILFGPEELPTGSFSLDRQPEKPSKVMVEISGFSSGDGDIIITGVKDGATTPSTETISFTANAKKLSVSAFSSISSIDSNLLSSEPTVGILSIKAKSQMNESVNARIKIVDQLEVSFQPESSRLDRVDFTKVGAEEIFASYVYFNIDDSVYKPENRDVFVNSILGEWEIANIGIWQDIFYQIRLKAL